jgi:hypothetical protein
MAVFDIVQADVQRLDSTLLAKVVIPSIPCDHCRQPITFRVIRVGSITEQLPTISNSARRLARTSALITLPLDALLIAELLREQHIHRTSVCPHCSEALAIDIFLTT